MNIQGLPGTGMTLAPAATSSVAANSPATATPTPTTDSAEETFIKLLVTEMQSQDPTSPMDPTTMVGQMFQMNQLQQLIDINQTLSNALGGGGGAGSGTGSANSSAPAGLLNSGTSLLHAAAS